MPGHPTYKNAIQYPVDAEEIAAQPSQPAKKKAKKDGVSAKAKTVAHKAFMKQLHATEDMVEDIWDGKKWRPIMILEDHEKSLQSVLEKVPEEDHQDEKIDECWKSFFTLVFTKSSSFRGNTISYYSPHRKGGKEFLANCHNVQALVESADQVDVDKSQEMDKKDESTPATEEFLTPVLLQDAHAQLLVDLSKPEFTMRILKLEANNKHTAPVTSHEIATKAESLPPAATLQSFLEFISVEFLPCRFLETLIRIPKFQKDKKRLPDEVEGVINGQQHLVWLLKARMVYLLQCFLDKRSHLVQPEVLKWINAHQNSIAHLDASILEEGLWVRIWEFLLAKVVPTTDQALTQKKVDHEMGRRSDIALLWTNPPSLEYTEAPPLESEPEPAGKGKAKPGKAAPAPVPPKARAKAAAKNQVVTKKQQLGKYLGGFDYVFITETKEDGTDLTVQVPERTFDLFLSHIQHVANNRMGSLSSGDSGWSSCVLVFSASNTSTDDHMTSLQC